MPPLPGRGWLLAIGIAGFAGLCLSATAIEQAEIAPLADHSLLLDAAMAATRMVVVGERGHVLLSDNRGKSWRQAKSVPTAAMLTAVFFVDDRHGWAVGHDEIVLLTEDGGEHWTKTHFAPEKERPLLDVWFKDPLHGLAVGAYSAYLVTSDGGRTWSAREFNAIPWKKPAVNAAAGDDDLGTEFHFNRLAASANGKLYLAGESGHLYVSGDAGQSWRQLPSPYEGSFYGVLPLPADSLLAFGLRGHLFRSDDAGASWRELPTGTLAMLTDAVAIDAGSMAVVGLGGTVLVSRDGGQHFMLQQQADRRGISTVLVLDAHRLVVAGESGLKNVTID
jgi:photosystem II stability/assembly factor-like uncharacterized protein